MYQSGPDACNSGPMAFPSTNHHLVKLIVTINKITKA